MIAIAALGLMQGMKPLADVAFDHEIGRIWLKATLNGKAVDAMLDSGAVDTTSDLDTALSVRGVKGEGYGADAAGGDHTIEGWTMTGLLFQVTGLSYRLPVQDAFRMPTVATPAGKVQKLMVGLDFFRAFVVAIDYSHNRVRFYAPSSFGKPAGYSILELKNHDGTPIATGRLQLPGLKERTVTIAFDTGSPVGMVVTNRMVRRDGLAQRFADRPLGKMNEEAMGGGLSLREVEGIRGQLGDMPVNGVVFLSLTEGGGFGKDADADVVVGDELLRHLDVVFDLPHSRLYFRPNGK